MQVYFFFFLYVHVALGGIYYIDDSRPYLHSNQQPLRFSEGGPAFVLASNNMVRINSRSIRVAIDAVILDSVIDKGWKTYSCNISAYALCASPFGSVFPSTSDPLFNSDNPAGLYCKNSKGRFFVNTSVYDISACDILDQGLEVVFSRNSMYIGYTQVPVWIYWVLIFTSVILVRAISLNVMSKIQHNANLSQNTTVVCCLLIFAIIFFQGDFYYLTENDNFFYWVNVMYILCYLCFHVYHSLYKSWVNPSHVQPRVFNLGSACLQAVAMRLYGTAETPYSIAIITMILVRLWEKDYQKRLMHICTGMFDCIYVSLLLYMGYSYDILYLFPLTLLTKIIAGHMIKQSI